MALILFHNYQTGEHKTGLRKYGDLRHPNSSEGTHGGKNDKRFLVVCLAVNCVLQLSERETQPEAVAFISSFIPLQDASLSLFLTFMSSASGR